MADMQDEMNMQDEVTMQDDMNMQDRNKKQSNKESSDGILGSMLAKIIAFFLLCIGIVAAGLGGAGIGYVDSYGGYKGNDSEFIRQLMTAQVWEDYRELKDHYMDMNYNAMENFLEKTNLDLEIYTGNDEDGYHDKVWGNYQGAETPYTYNIYTNVSVTEQQSQERFGQNARESVTTASSSLSVLSEETVADQQEMRQEIQLEFKFYVDPYFTKLDDYKLAYDRGTLLLQYRYVFPVMIGIGILLSICSFLFLMCAAGHHRNQKGVSKGILTIFHFDMVTIFFVAVALLLLILLAETTYNMFYGVLNTALFLLFLLAEAVWCTIYCMEFALELKLGILFKNTIIGKILVGLIHFIEKIWKQFVKLCKGLPATWRALIAYGVLFLAELFGIYICDGSAQLLVLWFMEKVLLLFVIVYVTFMWKRLEWTGEALAEGDMDYRVDTSGMVFTFKKQGESLNRIGEGISLAVEERMKSEHLKTELITNVSHDLKTPLTSIINYADLLGALPEKEDIDREKLGEYAEVLLRQSKRLKKLLEDLIEASKATTGNLEVNLTSCEIGVLLSQTVGEYEQKLQEKQMQLIIRQPEEPVVIQADGRHLWRIFDNLFNNIYKYGQENTRVYLTVEQQGKEILIAFKNISQYPLEMSGEELQERFVRGDKSRHMEGNGLGLSIAGSLAELQGGSMEITTDGDLFKVVLYFPKVEQ